MVSVDGLGSMYVDEELMPALTYLIRHGAATLNARTELELTDTLPNHTGMITGRPVEPAIGGHGVTWNTDDPRKVPPGVDSVFSVIDESGGSSAVFVGKTKFEMWDRSWPDAVDRFVINADQPALVDAAIAEVASAGRELTFLHIAGPDAAGHAYGWGSDAYDAAVAEADRAIFEIASTIENDPELRREVVLVVTADHGGVPRNKVHGIPTIPANYTVPFVIWGRGIVAGDLYQLNPEYADPGRGRPDYAGPQPVRNGDVANLVTDLLDLGPVPGSQFDAAHDLTVANP